MIRIKNITDPLDLDPTARGLGLPRPSELLPENGCAAAGVADGGGRRRYRGSWARQKLPRGCARHDEQDGGNLACLHVPEWPCDAAEGLPSPVAHRENSARAILRWEEALRALGDCPRARASERSKRWRRRPTSVAGNGEDLRRHGRAPARNPRSLGARSREKRRGEKEKGSRAL